jgi:hypothetical protein
VIEEHERTDMAARRGREYAADGQTANVARPRVENRRDFWGTRAA